jgi:hypothetical protein
MQGARNSEHEAYLHYAAVPKDEGNAADGRFSSAC